MTSDYAGMLLKCIATDKIEILRIENCKINDLFNGFINSVLASKNSSLKKLYIADCALSLPQVKKITATLIDNTSLEILSLTDNAIVPVESKNQKKVSDNINDFIKNLSNNKNLIGINFEGNNLSEDDMMSITYINERNINEPLRNAAMMSIANINAPLKEAAEMYIADIERNTNELLGELAIYNTVTEQDNIIPQEDHIENMHLNIISHVYHIDNMHLTESHARRVSKTLDEGRITTLWIDSSWLDCAGIDSVQTKGPLDIICSALEKNTTLKVLYITNCGLSTIKAQRITFSLRFNTSLEILSLANNGIVPSSAKDYPFACDIIQCIVDDLLQNTSLLEIHLEGNGLEEYDVNILDQIKSLLEQNKKRHTPISSSQFEKNIDRHLAARALEGARPRDPENTRKILDPVVKPQDDDLNSFQIENGCTSIERETPAVNEKGRYGVSTNEKGRRSNVLKFDQIRPQLDSMIKENKLDEAKSIIKSTLAIMPGEMIKYAKKLVMKSEELCCLILSIKELANHFQPIYFKAMMDHFQSEKVNYVITSSRFLVAIEYDENDAPQPKKDILRYDKDLNKHHLEGQDLNINKNVCYQSNFIFQGVINNLNKNQTKILWIERCKINNAALELLISTLKNNSSLEKLHIINCGLTSARTTWITASLESSQLEIDFNGNKSVAEEVSMDGKAEYTSAMSILEKHKDFESLKRAVSSLIQSSKLNNQLATDMLWELLYERDSIPYNLIAYCSQLPEFKKEKFEFVQFQRFIEVLLPNLDFNLAKKIIERALLTRPDKMISYSKALANQSETVCCLILSIPQLAVHFSVRDIDGFINKFESQKVIEVIQLNQSLHDKRKLLLQFEKVTEPQWLENYLETLPVEEIEVYAKSNQYILMVEDPNFALAIAHCFAVKHSEQAKSLLPLATQFETVAKTIFTTQKLQDNIKIKDLFDLLLAHSDELIKLNKGWRKLFKEHIAQEGNGFSDNQEYSSRRTQLILYILNFSDCRLTLKNKKNVDTLINIYKDILVQTPSVDNQGSHTDALILIINEEKSEELSLSAMNKDTLLGQFLFAISNPFLITTYKPSFEVGHLKELVFNHDLQFGSDNLCEDAKATVDETGRDVEHNVNSNYIDSPMGTNLL